MDEAVVVNKGDDLIDMPPGFRFHPTDEEIISHYLREKVMNSRFSACAIGEVDLNRCEPWDLPNKAKMGEKEWYFFCQRDRKYPTGMRTNRATESGYWKATGKDREIYKGKGCLVGMKKTLVFYKGRAPKGEKTNWVMHEFRLEGKFSYYSLPRAAKDEWVVCRVFHKSTGFKKTPIHDLLRVNSFGDDFLDYSSLPPLMEPMEQPYSSNRPSCSSFNEDGSNNEFKAMASRTSDGHYFSNFPTSVVNGNNQNFIQPSSNSHSHQAPTSIFHPQFPLSKPLINPGFQANPTSMPGYLHQLPQSPTFDGNDQTFLMRASAVNSKQASVMEKLQCKVEQFSSNQSMVSLSQDTGLSTDVNTTTEISSVISNQDIRNNHVYEDLEGPSPGPITDTGCFWDY